MSIYIQNNSAVISLEEYNNLKSEVQEYKKIIDENLKDYCFVFQSVNGYALKTKVFIKKDHESYGKLFGQIKHMIKFEEEKSLAQRDILWNERMLLDRLYKKLIFKIIFRRLYKRLVLNPRKLA